MADPREAVVSAGAGGRRAGGTPRHFRRRDRRRPAVFLDRDGTLVRDVRHGADPAAFELLPGVGVALSALQGRGYRLVVVTNQSGVARGLFTLGEARAAGRYLASVLAREGIALSGYYLCPHHVDGRVARFAMECDCRKPAPGMLVRAADELGLAPGRSWIVGDAASDVAAGRDAGVRGVLIASGVTAPVDMEALGALAARNVAHAAAVILHEDGKIADPASFGLGLGGPVRGERPRGADVRGPGDPSAWPGPLEIAQADADARALALLVALGKRGLG